jgi:hypothetical protein
VGHLYLHTASHSKRYCATENLPAVGPFGIDIHHLKLWILECFQTAFLEEEAAGTGDLGRQLWNLFDNYNYLARRPLNTVTVL